MSLMDSLLGALGATLPGSVCAADGDSAVLPEVTVTAREDGYQRDGTGLTRLPGPLRDIPQSITVVPQQLIEEQGATTLREALLAGQSNLYSLAVGAACLALILLLKRFKQLPTILIAVVLATLAVGLFDLDSQGVKVLGELPQGLPTFALPWLSGVDLAAVG